MLSSLFACFSLFFFPHNIPSHLLGHNTFGFSLSPSLSAPFPSNPWYYSEITLATSCLEFYILFILSANIFFPIAYKLHSKHINKEFKFVVIEITFVFIER